MGNNVVHGFKVFNPDWTCSPAGNAKQYACPGKFEEEGELDVCGHGMHFCKKAADCFNYYRFDPKNKVAEVVAYGTVVEDDDKCCTDKLEIIREVPWQELLEIVNTGKGCTGLGNSGNRNSGDWNSGDRNSGDWNSGNGNSGNRNSGDRNSGKWNSGDWNSGDRNSGDWNSGNWNSGNRNSGDWNSGNGNSGNRNSGDWNSGDRNSGNWNSGDWNSGDRNIGNWNSGNWNSGNRNSGDWNIGNWNSGNRNSGNWNSGDWNSGDRNSGNWNSGDWNKSSFNTGCFNTVEQKILLFNKPSDMTYRDWCESDARGLLNQIPKDVVEWICSGNMTDEEKEQNPEYKTIGGYLKVLDESECGQIWWDGLSDKMKKVILNLPNFDFEIFEQCTGIKAN